MPQFNLLLPPLLGGFIFASCWYPLRYYTLRSDGYRLIFTSAIAGLFFLMLACVVTAVLWPLRLCQDFSAWWHFFFPPEGSGRSALAFILGAISWWPLNQLGKRGIPWFSDQMAVDREIKRKSDPLELLLRKALGAKKLLSVSMKSSKVYIGYLKSNFNPAFQAESISLIPMYSGHRTAETKELVIDIDYDTVYEADRERFSLLLQEETDKARSENPTANPSTISQIAHEKVAKQFESHLYEIILPIAEIQSVNIFDVEVYRQHFEAQS